MALNRSVAAGGRHCYIIDGGTIQARQMEANKLKWLIEHSDNFAIGYENIAVDSVGVGTSVLSMAAKDMNYHLTYLSLACA